jgi:hypothetical protein
MKFIINYLSFNIKQSYLKRKNPTYSTCTELIFNTLLLFSNLSWAYSNLSQGHSNLFHVHSNLFQAYSKMYRVIQTYSRFIQTFPRLIQVNLIESKILPELYKYISGILTNNTPCNE